MQSVTCEVNTTDPEAGELWRQMTIDDLAVEVERVQGEVEEHRQEIETKLTWLAGCRARLAELTA